MDAATGLVLYEYNARTPLYPASITKIMTALVVLDHATDLNENVAFCHDSVFGIPRTSAHIYMDVGETLTIEQALYALMLESANEVSLALAIHIAGSVPEFAELMNLRAAQLGAYDTHFVNPSGLPARGHVTTAYDMALIKREAVRNDVFRRIISTVRFDIPPTQRQPDTRHLLNSNRQIRVDQHQHFNEDIIGGKTGWTINAGNTLTQYAYRDGRRLITVTLQGAGAGPFHDTTSLLNFGFALPMEYVTVFDAEAYTLTLPVKQTTDGITSEIGRVRLQADSSLEFAMPHNWQPDWIHFDIDIPETLEPPILLDTAIGHVNVYVQDVFVGNVTLRARDAAFAYTLASGGVGGTGGSTNNAGGGAGGTNTGADAGSAIGGTGANYTVNYNPPTVAYPSYGLPYSGAVYPYVPGFRLFTSRFEFLNNEYVQTLIIPIGVSLLTLIIAGIVALVRRRRRGSRFLRTRRSKFSRLPHYRYK